MKLLELFNDLIRNVNDKLRRGKEVNIPYKSMRSPDQLAVNQINLKIHESTHIHNVYNVIKSASMTLQTSISTKLPGTGHTAQYGRSDAIDSRRNVMAST